MRATLPLLIKSDFPSIRRRPLETLQVNLGYLCNQSCLHCHVNAGPTRKEMMDGATVDEILTVLAQRRLTTLDLTGGAPELNPHFRYLVEACIARGTGWGRNARIERRDVMAVSTAAVVAGVMGPSWSKAAVMQSPSGVRARRAACRERAPADGWCGRRKHG